MSFGKVDVALVLDWDRWRAVELHGYHSCAVDKFYRTNERIEFTLLYPHDPEVEEKSKKCLPNLAWVELFRMLITGIHFCNFGRLR